MKILSYNEFLDEAIVAVGFGTNNTSKYSIGSSDIGTGYNMTPFVGKVTGLGNQIAKEAWVYEKNDNPKHTAKEFINESRKYINNVIDECVNNFTSTNESILTEKEKEYEFKPNETAQRLKEREEMNIRRYRDAQKRGDNFAIKKYELRITLDKIDKKKLEVQMELYKLEKKFRK